MAKRTDKRKKKTKKKHRFFWFLIKLQRESGTDGSRFG